MITGCDGVGFGLLIGYTDGGRANVLFRKICIVDVTLNQVRRDRRLLSFSYIVGSARNSLPTERKSGSCS